MISFGMKSRDTLRTRIARVKQDEETDKDNSKKGVKMRKKKTWVWKGKSYKKGLTSAEDLILTTRKECDSPTIDHRKINNLTYILIYGPW